MNTFVLLHSAWPTCFLCPPLNQAFVLMSNTHTDSFLTASSMAVMLSRWQVLQAGRKTPISWLWPDPLLWSRCLQVWVTQWQQIPGSDEFMFYFCANCSLFQSDTFHSVMSYHSKTLDTFKDQNISAGLSLVPALCPHAGHYLLPFLCRGF